MMTNLKNSTNIFRKVLKFQVTGEKFNTSDNFLKTFLRKQRKKEGFGGGSLIYFVCECPCQDPQKYDCRAFWVPCFLGTAI